MIEPGKHKLVEAMEGQGPADSGAGPAQPKGPSSTPEQVAEETRREQEARSYGRPDRDDYLVNAGRGHQTHG